LKSDNALLCSARLRFFEAGPEDAGFLYRLMNERDYLAFIGDRGIRSIADAQQYIDEKISLPYGKSGLGLFITRLRNNRPIGICGLLQRDYLDAPDVGYAFLQSEYNKGYATEAVLAVINYAREKLGIKKLYAITAIENHASRRVLVKTGFEMTGLLDEVGQKNICLFALG